MNRLRFALLCVLAWDAWSHAALGRAPAAAYPTRPIRMLVGFTTGSSTDIASRTLARAVSAQNGHMVALQMCGFVCLPDWPTSS